MIKILIAIIGIVLCTSSCTSVNVSQYSTQGDLIYSWKGDTYYLKSTSKSKEEVTANPLVTFTHELIKYDGEKETAVAAADYGFTAMYGDGENLYYARLGENADIMVEKISLEEPADTQALFSVQRKTFTGGTEDFIYVTGSNIYLYTDKTIYMYDEAAVKTLAENVWAAMVKDDYIYYAPRKDYTGIYRMDMYGRGNEKVLDVETLENIPYDDGSLHKGFLFRLVGDGGFFRNIVVYDGSMYFLYSTDNIYSRSVMYKYNLETRDLESFADDMVISSFIINNDKFYFTGETVDEENYGIYKMDIFGDDVQLINDDIEEIYYKMYICGSKLYYYEGFFNPILKSIDL